MTARKSSAKVRMPVSRKSSNAKTTFEKLTAWSFSRLNTWETCPARARYLYIDKRQEKKGEPLIRGSRIHNEAMKYVKEGGRLPKSLIQFRDEFKMLRKLGAAAEEQWAFNKAWESCTWFGKDVWVRIMVDANFFLDEDCSTLTVVDYKTGRKKSEGEYEDQLELYALGGFCTYDVDEVFVELWFLDSGDIVGDKYKVRQVPSMKKKFEKRAKRMLNDERFQATPNYTCRFCSFNAKKGGPCKVGD